MLMNEAWQTCLTVWDAQCTSQQTREHVWPEFLLVRRARDVVIKHYGTW